MSITGHIAAEEATYNQIRAQPLGIIHGKPTRGVFQKIKTVWCAQLILFTNPYTKGDDKGLVGKLLTQPEFGEFIG